MTLRQVPGDREPGHRAPPTSGDEIFLNELYLTVQGECGWIGTPTVFVRTSHCPLRCTWCDSKYTFSEGTQTPVPEVLERVATHRVRHVCLTGGEPLAQPSGFRLARELVRAGYTVEVETAGNEDVSPFNEWSDEERGRLTINLDVKCPASAMTNFNRWSNLAALHAHDQVKFVLADRADYEYARGVIDQRNPPGSRWLHPVWGKLEAQTIADWVLQDGVDARVGIQLHKFLWGEKRGV